MKLSCWSFQISMREAIGATNAHREVSESIQIVRALMVVHFLMGTARHARGMRTGNMVNVFVMRKRPVLIDKTNAALHARSRGKDCKQTIKICSNFWSKFAFGGQF